MSLEIAFKGPEGIVLAADSRATVMETNMEKTMKRRQGEKRRKSIFSLKGSAGITKRYFEDVLRKVSKPTSSPPQKHRKE